VEQIDGDNNYHAEALGFTMLLIVLVLRATTARPKTSPLQYHQVAAYCDNTGVVKHGLASQIPLKEGQVQADVLNAIKQYVRELPCDVKYEHIYGRHLDDILRRWDQLTLPQKLNVPWITWQIVPFSLHL